MESVFIVIKNNNDRACVMLKLWNTFQHEKRRIMFKVLDCLHVYKHLQMLDWLVVEIRYIVCTRDLCWTRERFLWGIFLGILESILANFGKKKHTENSERLSRKEWHGIEHDTSYLPVIRTEPLELGWTVGLRSIVRLWDLCLKVECPQWGAFWGMLARIW